MKKIHLSRKFWLVLNIALVACALMTQIAYANPVNQHWELYRSDTPTRGGYLAVLWVTPQKEAHLYGNPPGDTGLPTTLSVTLNGEEKKAAYPPGKAEPDTFEPNKTIFAYETETPLFVPLMPGELQNKEATLNGTLKGLLCTKTSCMPIQMPTAFEAGKAKGETLKSAESQPWWREYRAALSMSDGQEAQKSHATDLHETQGFSPQFTPQYFAPGFEVTGLGKALLLAFIAGFILNFMPCVLPVISLKISALLGGAQEEDEKKRIHAFREHNVFFSLGILLYFVFLAGILSSLGLAWGQIFQKPYLVIGITALIFALSLSLFGLFNLPVIDLKTSGTSKSPRMQALFTGILATLLATPCSGPFLGGVLGWVLAQPPLIVALVFVFIGLGMSSPFLAMAVFPSLAKRFPKPGRWCGYLEQGVGLFLLATCVYLLSIIPQSLLIPAMAFMWVIALAAWIWGQWTSLSQSALKRWSIRAAAAALVVAAWPLLMQADAPEPWAEFQATQFEELFGKEPIILDFSAAWCTNCKALKKTTLTPDKLQKWSKEYRAKLIQVDLTDHNPDGMKLLNALGSQSIPVVAIFPKGDRSKQPLVLRDLFTSSQMEQALASHLKK